MADFKTPNSAATANNKKHDESSFTMDIDGSEEDKILSKSQYLTYEEVLKRRSRHCRQLDRCYREYYWALMEDLRAQYRKYVWIHGKSPYREDEERDEVEGSAAAENHHNNSNNNQSNMNNNNLNGGLKERAKCAMSGCKTVAMELTRYCHLHIMSDIKQTLYRACTFVTKSAPSGPIYCGKPILKTTVPSSCANHLQNAEKHLARALKRQGFNVSASPRVPPKLHVIVAEYVRQIQMKRRAAKKRIADKSEDKEADTNVQIKQERGS